ncbi:MAG: hypothetical protein ACR65R_11405 [Methylomicrobium sp.]
MTVATLATQDIEPLPAVAKVATVTVANPTESKIDNTDDRYHCRECRNLRNGYCIRQRFRPVDDIPRRCEDFTGYPAEIGKSASSERQTSETADNAQGRYFKFLITRQDGTQFYSCSMPRMAIEEVREQYPGATNIEPVENEAYDDDSE